MSATQDEDERGRRSLEAGRETIEAADKQLRPTRRFLDEQASEREMERDEAAEEIRFLQEQLKERERDKERDMRITSEVEALESHMREMSSLMSDTEAKKPEKESELKAAVDKWICVSREIITDLKQQLQAKIEEEESLQMEINQLEIVITAGRTKHQQELVQELDAIKSAKSENRHLNEQINHLQKELSKHKLSSEHFNVNSSVLKQMKAEQEIFLKTVSEQLSQIEAMRGRLDRNKQSAPFAQKQTTSRLELQVHEATTKYHSLMEQTITDKETELKELKAQLERTNQMLTEKEAEMENFIQSENGALQKIERLKDQLKLVQEEKKMLQIKLGTQEHTQLELPQLIDTMLADKNEEIDHLKEQLSKKEKQLNAYSSLALDDVQLRELTKQAEAKNSALTLSDILSIHSECEEFPEAAEQELKKSSNRELELVRTVDNSLKERETELNTRLLIDLKDASARSIQKVSEELSEAVKKSEGIKSNLKVKGFQQAESRQRTVDATCEIARGTIENTGFESDAIYQATDVSTREKQTKITHVSEKLPAVRDQKL